MRYSRDALLQNQTVTSLIYITHRDMNRIVSKTFMVQYAIGKACSMLYESVSALLEQKLDFSEDKKRLMAITLHVYVSLLQNWNFSLSKQTCPSLESLKKSGEILNELQKSVGQEIVSCHNRRVTLFSRAEIDQKS